MRPITSKKLVRRAVIIICVLLSTHMLYYYFNYDDLTDMLTRTTSQLVVNKKVSSADYYGREHPNFKFDRLKVLLSQDKYEENDIVVRNYDLIDKRLLPAYWLYQLNNNNNGEIDPSLKLPFNWNLLTDFPNLIQQNKHFNKLVKNHYTCKKFLAIDANLRRKHRNLDIAKYCTDTPVDENNTHDYKLPFEITEKMDIFFKTLEFRRMYNMVYTINNFPIPQNVMFLNAVNSNQSVVVPLQWVSMGENDFKSPLSSYYTNISNHIIDLELARNSSLTVEEVLLQGVSIVDQLDRLNDTVKSLPRLHNPQTYITRPSVISPSTDLLRDPLLPVSLNPDLFNWDLAAESARVSPATHPELHSYLSRQLDHTYHEDRYFGVAHVRGLKLDHYDWRFFKEETVKTAREQHVAVLHRLARTWSNMCRQYDIPTWLNHGPLIGWYWNGLSMPFDADLDFQMPIQSLHHMAKFLNDTLVYDFTEFHRARYVNSVTGVDNFAELGMRSFYFEVNNNYPRRNRFQADRNNIDARLIDTETGVYIDITALSFFQQANSMDWQYERDILKSMTVAEKERFYKGVSYERFYDNIYKKLEIPNGDLARLAKDIAHETITSYDHDKMLSPMLGSLITDRNYHSYQIHHFRNMLPVYYENYPTYIPQNFLHHIISEYSSQAILSQFHKAHRFSSDLHMWVSHADCPFFNEVTGELEQGATEEGFAQRCLERSPAMMDKFMQTTNYTALHRGLKNLVVDIHNVESPLIDTQLLSLQLHKFDDNLLRPEVWSKEYLFGRDAYDFDLEQGAHV